MYYNFYLKTLSLALGQAGQIPLNWQFGHQL